MNHPFKPYPDYKPTGIEWLGDVPAHWEVRRLCNSVAECVSGTWGTDPNGADDLPCIRVADFDREQKRVCVTTPTMRAVTLSDRRQRLLRPGDLLLEKSGGGQQQPVGAVVLYDQEGDAVCSNFIARIVTKEGYDPKFLVFLHSALYAIGLNKRSIKQTTGIQNIDVSAYFGEHVAFPPLSEQAAMAAYLDDICGKIHHYVAVKERLVKLLEEYRRAIIHRAVTRGLDPNVPLKPTGIEWLGDVPAHWEVLKLGQFGRFSKGSGGTKEDETDKGVPCIRYGDIYKHYRFFVTESQAFISEELSDRYTPIQYGDVLFAGSGETIDEIGKSVVNLMTGPAYCGGDVILFRPSIEVNAKFLGYATDCSSAAYQKSCMGRGVTVMHIYASELKYMIVAFPPLSEQTAIAEYLDKATAGIDAAIRHARREHTLLREYRTALIAHAVTGKLDLREA